MLAAVSTIWPKRVATATPASQTTTAISSVESTCPIPAWSEARAVSTFDQPRWRAINVIGTQWSGTIVWRTPTAATAPINGEPHVLIEANIDEGVVSAPLSKYLHCQTRICRPVGLSDADCEKVCRYASERIGLGYDFKNVIDLMRYLFPWPVTQRWRRRTIALGSSDASRIICSSLIAQAFDAVRYPILPKITRVDSQTAPREIAEIRHSSLYAPRDFDISPYFMVVKPTLAHGFNYKDMHWADLPKVHTAQVTLAPDIEGAIAEVAYARISRMRH